MTDFPGDFAELFCARCGGPIKPWQAMASCEDGPIHKSCVNEDGYTER